MKAFSSLWYKVTHRPDGTYFNPLVHIFFYITFVFGFSFTFLNDTENIKNVILFAQSEKSIGYFVISVWGVAAMLITIANTYSVVNRKFSPAPALLGFMLWLYAGVIYGMTGFYFQLAVVGVPNLIFWGWYYVQIRAYGRAYRLLQEIKSMD